MHWQTPITKGKICLPLIRYYSLRISELIYTNPFKRNRVKKRNIINELWTYLDKIHFLKYQRQKYHSTITFNNKSRAHTEQNSKARSEKQSIASVINVAIFQVFEMYLLYSEGKSKCCVYGWDKLITTRMYTTPWYGTQLVLIWYADGRAAHVVAGGSNLDPHPR